MKLTRFLNEMDSSRLVRLLFLAVAFVLLATIVRLPPPRPPAGAVDARLDIVPIAPTSRIRGAGGSASWSSCADGR